MHLNTLKKNYNQENLSDRELIKSIKHNKCSECIHILRDRHIGLIIDIYSKYNSILQSLNFSAAEFNDEIEYIIFHSARSYDLRRKNVKFSTWLGEQTKYFCLNKINEQNKQKILNTDPEELNKIIDSYSKEYNSDRGLNRETCDYIFNILEQLNDKRIIKIFNLRFFEGNKKMTWKQISKKVGLTSQGAINLFEKGIDFLKVKLRSTNNSDVI